MSKRKKSQNSGENGRLTRKDVRKQQRKLKKQTKDDNFRRHVTTKKQPISEDKPGKFVLLNKTKQKKTEVTSTAVGPSDKKSLGEQMKEELLAEKRKQKSMEKDMQKQRRRQLVQANREEDKTIKLLEKQLKLNKRKSNTTSKAFVESGLDYILDVCDSSKIQAAVQAEMNLQESASEFEEDLAVITGKSRGKKKLCKTMAVKSGTSDSELESGDEEMDSEGFGQSDEEDFSGESDEGFSDENGSGEDSDEAPDELPSKKGRKNTQKVEPQYDGSSDISGDSDDSSGPQKKTSPKKRKQPTPSINSKNSKKRKIADDDDFEDGEDDFDGDEDDFEEDEDGDGSKEKRADPNGFQEDIYGRLRDKQGNVVQPNTSKYMPPHLRNEVVDDKKKAELDRLNKTLKGQLNRLAENNMHSIANQIDELYMRHSRHDMNNALLKQYVDSLISPVHTPERLVMEHAMLIAILHANVGSEVGAFFLQHLGKKFHEMHAVPQEIENKELDNLVLLLCHMYTFKIFDSVLLYDILQELVSTFTPKDVDVILVVLRTVGFGLRKDNPLALKDFILKVQKLANAAGQTTDDSRVRFMLDVLLSIKNNNMSKIPQYDTDHSEHLKKIIKPMFRKGNYVTEMKITLEELLKADERGKWWVVGSAWTGPAPQADKTSRPSISAPVNTVTQEILDLAKKQRMNTVNRKNIFCILMTAEDYLDAFEKLLKLGLKGQPEQDIVHVLIHCLLSEGSYNPYYAHIADQLCLSDRRHRMTIQYAVWDRFKELKTHSNVQVTNLAKFLAHLFLQNSLPLSALKVLEFTEMDKPCVRLLRQILLTLLLHDDQEAVLAVFSRVAKPSKLLMFRESLRLFMHHFLLKNIKDEGAAETMKLTNAISAAEEALMVFSDTR